MNDYTIFWTPEQQSAFLIACPFINAGEAEWMGEYFALVQRLNEPQYEDVLAECQSSAILGIKPGANPGVNPNGCA